MSGDLQPRKRKGKGKKKDDLEDDIADVKQSKVAVNGSHRSQTSGGSSGSEGSGVVAKVVFLILLVALSLVVALILVELRGKRASMKDAATGIPEPVVEIPEDPPVPDIPLSVVEESLPEPPPPPPILQQVEEEEFEPLEATPPLEEYVKVVHEAPDVVEPPQAVQEVVEVEAPLVEEEEEEVVEEPQVVKIVEEVEVPVVVEEVVPVEVPVAVEEPVIVEEVVTVEVPVVEEVVEVIIEEVPVVEVVEVEEEQAVPVEEVIEVVKVVEVVEVVEEEAAPAEEEAAPVQEEAAPVEEVVEEAAPVQEEKAPPVEGEAASVVEEAAPVEEEEAAPVEEEAAPVEEKEIEEPVEEEKEEDGIKDPEDEDEDEEEEEDEEPSPIQTQIKEDEGDDEEDWSQYGKEGSTEALTEAYLGVESLAGEILKVDSENAMVAQLTPHLAGVLRAIEEGQTEGLLDTLRHIEVILEDVKRRVNQKEKPVEEEVESVFPPSEETKEDPSPAEEVTPDLKPLQEAVEEKVADDTQPPMYEKADITSEIDNSLREELDAADELLTRNPAQALNSFGSILQRHPKSARAIYGRASSLDRLAEIENSNTKLEKAIIVYRSVLDLADEDPSLVPLPLLRLAGDRCINRMTFRGFLGKAVRVQQRLLQRFPEDLKLRNQMGVAYLMMNQAAAAKEVFHAILQKWPQDGFALVHYGFVLKQNDHNNTGAVWYMQRGIKSKEEGTQDARFYYHLGDALQRLNRNEEAYEVYDDAVALGVFLNRYQRSIYNIDRLTSRPFWTPEQTTYQLFFRNLEENWEAIRDEGVALLSVLPKDGFRPEKEHLSETGIWKQYELFARGRKFTANCVTAPKTCSLIENFAPASGNKRGQVKFSVMEPGTHIHAHTGPTNCRLRAHLGLLVPPGLRLRVANETTTWEEGKILIFDDSWEHEVWHEGSSNRLVLIVDVWHPEITELERKQLVAL